VNAPPALFALDDAQLRSVLGAQDGGGIPCFVYDLGVARRRFETLRAAMPSRVALAYAVKSNPGGPLLRTLAEAGARFDCASAGEVARVRAAGPDSPILMAGPAKSQTDLRAAVYAGARVQVDGIEDVARLHAMHPSRAAGDLRVSVRVNPAAPGQERAAIIGGGGPSAFGVDEEALPEFLEAARDYPGVRIDGLQVFSASNELDSEALLRNHAIALAIGRRMHEDHGVQLQLVDLGGGLGIPYRAGEDELDLPALGLGLSRLLADHPWFGGELLLEPGRWLSGPCGVYAARVIRTKVSRGVSFALLEGGINHLLRPLLTGQSFPVRTIRLDSGPPPVSEEVEFTLAGPLCTSLDRVGTGDLPADTRPGDIVVFGQAGAYAYTQAMTHFLSHPAPAEHWLPAGDREVALT
jgi:diaminopimelate decarboxylase